MLATCWSRHFILRLEEFCVGFGNQHMIVGDKDFWSSPAYKCLHVILPKALAFSLTEDPARIMWQRNSTVFCCDGAGCPCTQSVPVRLSAGNWNTSLGRSPLAQRIAFWESTPLSLDRYANCVGAANSAP